MHILLLESYWDLHKWSIQNYTKFIEEIWHFFEIIASEPYKEVNIDFIKFLCVRSMQQMALFFILFVAIITVIVAL